MKLKMMQRKISLLRPPDEYGFSLMELLVVIAIGGLLAGLAIPSYISKMPHNRLQEAARGLYGAMQQVRLLAVKENRNKSIGFANDGTDFIYFNENGNYAAGEKRVDLSAQYSDVRFGNGTATVLESKWGAEGDGFPTTLPFFITFTPMGTLVNGTVTNAVFLENITNPAESFAIIVQNSGAIKIVWFDKNTWK